MSAPDRPVLSRDLAGTVAHAVVDPTLEGRALQDGLRAAIATRGGHCWCDVDHAGWVVTLASPEEQTFCGRTRRKGGRKLPRRVGAHYPERWGILPRPLVR